LDSQKIFPRAVNTPPPPVVSPPWDAFTPRAPRAISRPHSLSAQTRRRNAWLCPKLANPTATTAPPGRWRLNSRPPHPAGSSSGRSVHFDHFEPWNAKRRDDSARRSPMWTLYFALSCTRTQHGKSRRLFATGCRFRSCRVHCGRKFGLVVQRRPLGPAPREMRVSNFPPAPLREFGLEAQS